MLHTSDGAELAMWSAGDAEEPFLLVHGFSLDHTTWEPVAERLVSAGHRVVALDLRGHGRSTLGSAPPTPERFVADLGDLISHLGLSGVHLVGHSLGAVIALTARSDSSLAGALASVTSIAGTEQSIQNPIMRLGARFFNSSAGIWLLRRRRPGRLMISTWFGKRPPAGDLDWIRTLSARCAPETRHAIGNATGHIDLRPTFRSAGPPTLVICGRRDRATPPKYSERIATVIVDAELSVVDDAGHMVIIEQPDVVADQLTAWHSRHT